MSTDLTGRVADGILPALRDHGIEPSDGRLADIAGAAAAMLLTDLREPSEALDLAVARALGETMRWPNHVERARQVRRRLADSFAAAHGLDAPATAQPEPRDRALAAEGAGGRPGAGSTAGGLPGGPGGTSDGHTRPAGMPASDEERG